MSESSYDEVLSIEEVEQLISPFLSGVVEFHEQALLTSLADKEFYRSGYPAYAYFLTICATNNWSLVSQSNGVEQNRTTVTKNGTVMMFRATSFEFHATIDDKLRANFYLYYWHLMGEHVSAGTPTTEIPFGNNHRQWIDSLLEFLKG